MSGIMVTVPTSLNLSTTSIRKVVSVVAAMCLLAVSARISGTDVELSQRHTSIDAAGITPAITGIGLGSRISTAFIPKRPSQAKHVDGLSSRHLALPFLSKSELLVARRTARVASAAVLPATGRSPPLTTI